MSLKETLLNDMKAAMVAKDKVRKDTIQMIRAGILQVEKDKQISLDDAAIAEVISRELKTRKESLAEYEKSGRVDLIEGIRREIEIVTSYLPKQLSEDEVEAIVRDAVAKVGATSQKDMGKLMKEVMPLVKGKADGSIVNATVKKLLG